jgi:hypothetical protein
MGAGAACGQTEGGVGSSALFRRAERDGQGTGRSQRRDSARRSRAEQIIIPFYVYHPEKRDIPQDKNNGYYSGVRIQKPEFTRLQIGECLQL